METVSPVQRMSGVVPGLLLGVGLGALVDEVVMQHLLRWHHALSATAGHPVTTVTGLQANARADGVLLLGACVVTLTGVLLTFSAWRHGRPSPTLSSGVGLLLAGWGLFDLLEGLLAHQLLGLHHVRDDLGAPLSWDLGFLGFGALLAVVGWQLYLTGRLQTHSVVQVMPPLGTFEAISSSAPVDERA